MKKAVQISESPRDAMQGVEMFIPTEEKIEYINQLLKVGFDTIDVGSFVSPKAIPQMRDTASVINGLDMSETTTKLLTIVANLRGAAKACEFDKISLLGFPFSISGTFQRLNTNTSFEESLDIIQEIQALCAKHDKLLVVYIPMAFGNPYGDEWNIDILHKYINKLLKFGVNIISLSDVLGMADANCIENTVKSTIQAYKTIEMGLHLHTKATDYHDKVSAAYYAGCRMFDTVINGYGGCPKTGKDLVGNLDTMDFYNFLVSNEITVKLRKDELYKAQITAQKVFLTRIKR